MLNRVRMPLMAAIAGFALFAGARESSAQQAYYGYPSAQAPSGQISSIPCQPGTPPSSCQPEKYGCTVVVCPCPCSTRDICAELKHELDTKAPIRRPPSCQEVEPCVILSEKPPKTTPQNVTVYRNCYVPLKLVVKEVDSPDVITPVNINVKWREIHYLCDAQGNPLPAPQAAEMLKELQAQLAQLPPEAASGAMAPASAPTSPEVPAELAPISAPASVPAPAPVAAPEPTTTASAPAPAAGPQKQWVWLQNEGMYGYGYQRADGYWEIDPGSRRATLASNN